MKGGHAHSGPPPDPNALRRDNPSDRAGWTSLPAAGRTGPVPAWPLSRPTQRETELWAREWTRPQAIMWEANGQQAEVALYVRSLAAAERPRASVASRTLVRQQQEALGLSLPGLLRLRWRITDEPAQDRTTDDEPSSIRDRFRLVVGGS